MTQEIKTEPTEYKSRKSASTYTVSVKDGKAYICVTGEASTNRKVLDEIERIRRGGGCDKATAEWTARMLSNTF